MKAKVWDKRACELGEGPLWHPERMCLFWFDIVGKKMYSKGKQGSCSWELPEMHSAAALIDRDRLLLASETALWVFDIRTGLSSHLIGLEAGDERTRSNDGRADPQGGFWIGTMGKNAENGLGSIWRYYRGELRRLFENITITNAISFSPCGSFACFADTAEQIVMRVALDEQGWPREQAKVFLNFKDQNLNPDGAVIDADGLFWVALWGDSRVVAFDSNGVQVHSISVNSPNVSCPAFGGEDMRSLYLTTARQGLTSEQLHEFAGAGCVFACMDITTGQIEHRVILN